MLHFLGIPIRDLHSAVATSMVTILLGALLSNAINADESQNGALSQAAMLKYTETVNRTREIEAEVESRLMCIEAREGELSARSNRLEETLGDHRRREKKLVAETERRRAEREGFRRELEKEEANYEQLERTLNSYRIEKWTQEENLRKCKKKWYMPNLVCDVGERIGKLTPLIDSVEGEIAASRRLTEIARSGLTSATENFEKSNGALTSAQVKSHEIVEEISQVEREIKRLKAVIADLRFERQSVRNLLQKFEAALEEVAAADTNDIHAHTTLKATQISGDVGQLIAHSSDVIERANSVLPAMGKNCEIR